MKNFLLGLGFEVLGIILFFIGGAIGATLLAFTDEGNPIVWLVYIPGAILMAGAPLAFWIILPIRKSLRRQKKRGKAIQ